MGTYTAKLYNLTIPNKGSQVIDSPASTFEVQRNRYDKQLQVIQSWKFESWKIHIIIIKPYVKLGSITTITSSKHSCSQEITNFVTWWFCIYNSSTNTNAFFQSYLIVYDCTSHVEGSCMGSDIPITSANCNPNCKPRCIYQVLKFPN